MRRNDIFILDPVRPFAYGYMFVKGSLLGDQAIALGRRFPSGLPWARKMSIKRSLRRLG
jgi:hypothetical protein